jgi:hypothetical protein
MGGYVSPILADLFLAHHESLWIRECPNNFKPIFYKRYVDDTFLLFQSKSNVADFLDYLNSKHDSIKFTCEIETADTLPFLDLTVKKHENGFTK